MVLEEHYVDENEEVKEPKINSVFGLHTFKAKEKRIKQLTCPCKYSWIPRVLDREIYRCPKCKRIGKIKENHNP